MVTEGSRSSKEEMPNCVQESGRLPEEGTPKLVLKEEQGPVKPDEGSLADETVSDAGWPVTQKNLQQKLVGGNEGGLALSQGFIPGSHKWLKNGNNTEVHPNITWPGLHLAPSLGCQIQKT